MLAARDFRCFLAGYATSLLGTSMSSVAIAFAVLDGGGTATDLGLVFAAAVVPQVMFMLAGGVLADRLGRRPVILGADALRCCAQAALFGVHCVSARDCWAVGTYEKHHAGLNEALHWNGRHWSAAPMPLPGGTQAGDVSELFDVTCTSARNCWSAGEYGTIAGASERLRNQALHWDGRRWSVAAVPDPGGTSAGDISLLDGVRCVTARDCWAVGAEGTIGSSIKVLNEALRWNGTRWSLHATRDPGGTGNGDVNHLNAVRCTSTTFCWAVGDRQRAGGADVNQGQRLGS